MNPATGQDSSDIDISGDIVNNAKALAPAFKQGASFMNFYTGATAGGAAVALGTAVAPPATLGIAARGFGWYYAAKGIFLEGRQGLMLGRFPEYLQDAEEAGANALNTKGVYNFFTSKGEWWTLNRAYLNANRLLGNGRVILSNVPWGQSGSYFADELRWMLSKGVGPQQWQYSRRLLGIPYNPSGFPYE